MTRPCRRQSSAKPQQPHAVSFRPSFRGPSAEQQPRVSLSETYTVAVTCKRKLGVEAGRADHHLRRLVCHANMLDTLMEELADRERGLEGKLNALIRVAPQSHSRQQIQWLEEITEEIAEVDSESDTDSELEDSDTEGDNTYTARCRGANAKKSPPPKLLAHYSAKSDEELTEDDEAHHQELILRRWPSRKRVPELTEDVGSDSEEEESAEHFRETFTKQCSVTMLNKPQRAATACLGSRVRVTAVEVDS